ncbi:MAG: ABC transporter permease [Deltaproteobacteria bacterium]|nr:ABC transporter permease [Deltaproteobacteria bacterium]
MLRHLLRRMVWTVPTLLGVTLVSFCLLLLLPVEPNPGFGDGIGAGAISSARESYRRALFLHLPVFVNTEPRDLRDAVGSALEEAARPGAAVNRLSWRLARHGMSILPVVGPRLLGLAPGPRTVAVGALDRIGARIGPHAAPPVSADEDRAEAWASYYEAHRLDFRSTHARRLVGRLIRSDSPVVREEILRLDTFALAELVVALEGRLAPASERRVVDLLCDITRRDQRLPPRATPQQRRAVIDAWREWWFLRDADFIERSADDRRVAMVTETRFAKWITRLVTLRLGYSLRDGRPVTDKLAERLPVTVLLALIAAMVSFAVAIPIGVLSAARRDRAFDRVSGLALLALYSLPSFWVATLLVRWLCGVGGLDLFPLRGLSSDGAETWPLGDRVADWAWHLCLPVLCLSYVSIAALSRYQRVAMLGVLGSDFVRTARAKGVGAFGVVVRHALRNALLPMITLLGLELPSLVGGAVIIEEIFGIPGMGTETLAAARARDVPWLVTVVALTAALTLIGMLASDVLYGVADPRIKPGSRGSEPS